MALDSELANYDGLVEKKRFLFLKEFFAMISSGSEDIPSTCHHAK
jgi:hypothetical protein